MLYALAVVKLNQQSIFPHCNNYIALWNTLDIFYWLKKDPLLHRATEKGSGVLGFF